MKDLVKARLELLSDCYTDDPIKVGICGELTSLRFLQSIKQCVTIEKWVRETAKTWEHHSGNDFYPVPDRYWSPKQAYARLPKWGDDYYGDMRRDLTRHLLNNLESLEL